MQSSAASSAKRQAAFSGLQRAISFFTSSANDKGRRLLTMGKCVTFQIVMQEPGDKSVRKASIRSKRTLASFFVS